MQRPESDPFEMAVLTIATTLLEFGDKNEPRHLQNCVRQAVLAVANVYPDGFDFVDQGNVYSQVYGLLRSDLEQVRCAHCGNRLKWAYDRPTDTYLWVHNATHNVWCGRDGSTAEPMAKH